MNHQLQDNVEAQAIVPFSTQVENDMISEVEYLDGLMEDRDEEHFYEHLFDVMVEEDQANICKDENKIDENRREAFNMDMTYLFETDQVFTSHEDASSHVKSVGRSAGIVLVTSGSDVSGRKRTPYIRYICERGGAPRDHWKGGYYPKKPKGLKGKNAPRDLNTKKKCLCPFEIKISMDRMTNTWRVAVLNGMHNHTFVKFDEGHSYLGRPTPEEVVSIASMTKSGILPKYIVNMLRANDDTNCTSLKTIYNMRAKLRVEQRQGRTVVQEVFHQADKTHSFIHERSEDNKVKDMFWAYEDSVSLARCFPYVLLMDATYKTNRYRLPMLQICGVTSTGDSFSIGFALLDAEREDNYTWALQTLRIAMGEKSDCVCSIVTDREEALMNVVRVVFPSAVNMLCTWHIQKGLDANLKAKADGEVWAEMELLWKELVESSTEEEYNERLLVLGMVFDEDALSYVTKTWLAPHKERFVHAWTNEVFNLNNHTTSRIEGMHSTFKNWLASGCGDMVKTWEAGVKMVEQEIRNIRKNFEISLFMDPKKYKQEKLFSELVNVVSFKALGLLEEEVRKVKSVKESCDVADNCGCSIKKTCRLPCFHDIARFEKDPGYIPISSIHVHWQTLDVVSPPPPDFYLDHVPIMHALEEKLNTATVYEKPKLLLKLREICHPRMTSLEEPLIKLKGKGRPKGSVNKKKVVDDVSTKRELSRFEHVEAAIKQSQESIATSKPKKRGRPKGSVNKAKVIDEASKRKKSNDIVNSRPQESKERYMRFIVDEIKPYVRDIVNVEPDGNCGFRAIALGVGLPQERWPLVRGMIKTEMIDNESHYKSLLMADALYKECLTRLDHEEGSCLEDRWFVNYLGWAVSNVWNVVFSIVSTSSKNSQTYLPSMRAPTEWPPKHVWLIKCDDHMVHATMIEGCPLPKVHYNWHKKCLTEAKEWGSKLEERFIQVDEESSNIVIDE